MGCWKGGRECQTPTTKSDWSAPERRRRCFGGREAVLSRSRSRSSLGTKLGFVDWLAGECSGSHLTDLTRPDQTRPDLTDRPTDKADRGLDSFCLWVGGRTWVSALPCPAQSCVSRSRLPKPSTTTGEPPASQQPASSRLAGRQPQHHTWSLKDRERQTGTPAALAATGELRPPIGLAASVGDVHVETLQLSPQPNQPNQEAGSGQD